MNDKIATLQDDLLAKDTLLERSHGKIERLTGKVQFLSVDLDDKKEKIKRWVARSGGFERERNKLAADLEARDKEMKDALEEIARMKRTAKVERDRAVHAARKTTSLTYREQILKHRAQKEKMDEAVLILKRLEQCRGNKELISEALKGEILDWASEMKDTEDGIAQYEADYAAISIPEVEDVPFTPYSDRSPADALATDGETSVINEHGSMLGRTDEILNSIPEENEEVAAFTPTPEHRDAKVEPRDQA